jgi:APA family basic amino acid/polyamine antiporter
MLGASVVAQGWSTYAKLFLEQIGLGWPDSIGPDSNVNVLAMLLIIVLTILATIGIKESLRVNLALVAVKLFVVLFVIIAGLFYVKGSNLTPFIPPSAPAASGDVTITTPLFQALLGFTPSTFGVMGLVSGASLVFFAFIGFDVVATTAEEAKNPQRDLPRGIIGSLAICTVLYVLVCIVITGMINYKDISSEAALAEAFRAVGRPGFATLISAGAVAGLTTVVLTLMIGAARVVFAMSRDHLVPRSLGKTHPKFGTPYRLTLGIGLVVAIVAGVTPIGKLEEMVNIGTLAAFTLVSIAVPLLRKSRPDIERSFRVPGNPVVPILAAVICLYLMLNLSIETWLRFAIWMVLGFIVYAFYGYRKSRVGETERTGETTRA